MTAIPCLLVAEGAESDNEQAWIADSWLHFYQARGVGSTSARPPVDYARLMARFADFNLRLQALVRDRKKPWSDYAPECRPIPDGESTVPNRK